MEVNNHIAIFPSPGNLQQVGRCWCRQADQAKVKEYEEHEAAPTCSSSAGMSDISNREHCCSLHLLTSQFKRHLYRRTHNSLGWAVVYTFFHGEGTTAFLLRGRTYPLAAEAYCPLLHNIFWERLVSSSFVFYFFLNPESFKWHSL